MWDKNNWVFGILIEMHLASALFDFGHMHDIIQNI